MTKVDVIEDGEFDFDKSARSAKIVRNLPFHQTVRRIMRDIEETFHDKYRYVTLSFYVYGLAGLMPWNFYITPENYWNDKLSKYKGIRILYAHVKLKARFLNTPDDEIFDRRILSRSLAGVRKN